jgi:hypothetical protein
MLLLLVANSRSTVEPWRLLLQLTALLWLAF